MVLKVEILTQTTDDKTPSPTSAETKDKPPEIKRSLTPPSTTATGSVTQYSMLRRTSTTRKITVDVGNRAYSRSCYRSC